ncbi:MAG: hypothetical protein IPN18_21450 [Ignavibacteriales bacterium]|mgnify:CR=1 FL=1|jgi:predicted HicB family RNase H-like nuclease|nr:hypothetical protein [Ignavibacteriales bacterium]
MDYKGYEAVVNCYEVAKIFSGEVINTKDVINIYGEFVVEIRMKSLLILCNNF